MDAAPTLLQLRHTKASPLARARGKKWEAVFRMPNGRCRSVTFGADGASDFTIHQDPTRWSRYLLRHGAAVPENKSEIFWARLAATPSKDLARRHAWALRSSKEHWSDPVTPGALSRFILWNKPDLGKSIRDALQYFVSIGALCVPTAGVRVVTGRTSDYPGTPKSIQA